MKNTSIKLSERKPSGSGGPLSSVSVFSTILFFVITLSGCDKQAVLESYNQELEHEYPKFLSTNLWISEISGRPSTLELSFAVSVGNDKLVLDYYLAENEDRCKNRIIINKEVDEGDLNQIFENASKSRRCLFAGQEEFNSIAMREIMRSVYLIFFPTVPFSMGGKLQNYNDTADRNIFYKYEFDISARTPVHYSWRTVKANCVKSTNMKILRISKVSDLLIPSAAIMEIGPECNSATARYYIEFRNPRVE